IHDGFLTLEAVSHKQHGDVHVITVVVDIVGIQNIESNIQTHPHFVIGTQLTNQSLCAVLQRIRNEIKIAAPTTINRMSIAIDVIVVATSDGVASGVLHSGGQG